VLEKKKKVGVLKGEGDIEEKSII